ncbi:phosphatase PAP2 family protein [Paenibacillus soyae]|uniref:Phosphatase PAP2 family protein n=1 Tax=Paenibacillus soyae TaxID=2969249 RepID=A0A9X2MQF8_9BACL|nr:phosphatase PAP2 family protein [Paenibacillus soyae]MCR2803973.1 phosphatase PAP2 family protein [Paenibacillus soyae]
MEWDYLLFKAINDAANNESVLGKLLVHAADWGDYFFFFSLLLMVLVNRKMAIYGMIAVGVTVMISRGMSVFYYRDRPFAVHDVNMLLPHIESNSFPSDHAAAAFAIAIMFYLLSRRIGIPFIGFAAVVAYSRIWVGKHYPTDVLAGALLGLAISIALYRLLEKFLVYERCGSLLNQLAKKRGVKSDNAGDMKM